MRAGFNSLRIPINVATAMDAASLSKIETYVDTLPADGEKLDIQCTLYWLENETFHTGKFPFLEYWLENEMFKSLTLHPSSHAVDT